MSELTDAAYDEVVFTLAQDPDVDVTVSDDGLLARGRRFAFLDDDHLVVKLPHDRAADLVARRIAGGRPEGEGWVSVSSVDLWLELAGEAHAFVGEPAVGGQS
ncbi:hypothetical protein [Frondihabitans peucedani]|uniref:Uncharacterized protein n=1 Tax=Frondihabitans peucedani TaxID=598626 RepID=A0ABP8E239_9MICO